MNCEIHHAVVPLKIIQLLHHGEAMTRVFFEEAKGVHFGLIYGVNEVYSIFLIFILKNGFYLIYDFSPTTVPITTNRDHPSLLGYLSTSTVGRYRTQPGPLTR